MEIPEKAREDIMKFQQIQQQLQMMLLQKQNVQIQLAEIENASKEVETTDSKEIFEVIGNIMVKKEKKELAKQLKEKKEILDLRIKTIDKQVDSLNKKSTDLQKKLSAQLEEKKK